RRSRRRPPAPASAPTPAYGAPARRRSRSPPRSGPAPRGGGTRSVLAEVRDDLTRKQLGAAHGFVVRHVADAPAADEHADTEILLNFRQAIAHRARAANQDVALAFELLEAELAGCSHAGQQKAPQRVLAQVAGRCEEVRWDLETAAKQPQQVGLHFAA